MDSSSTRRGNDQPLLLHGYEPNTRAKTEVQLSRRLVVKGTDIRKLDEDAVLQLIAKLLDVAQDAGGEWVGRTISIPITSTMTITAGRRAWFASFSKTSTSCRRGVREGDRRCAVAGPAAGAAEPGRAGADRCRPGNPSYRASRSTNRVATRTNTTNGWWRRSSRRSRSGSSSWCGSRSMPRPRQGTGGKLMNMRRFPDNSAGSGGLPAVRSWAIPGAVCWRPRRVSAPCLHSRSVAGRSPGQSTRSCRST